jgi:DNA-binding CsgD family transcriptional regulator
MNVRYRPMRPGDVRECVQIVAADPVAGPRYGSAITHLPSVWLRLLDWRAFRSVVLEDLGGRRPSLIGVGISAFITEDYARAVKGPPLFWVAPDLVRRVMAGDPPLLSERQLQDANTSTGLNNFVWHGCTRIEVRTRPEVHNCMLTAFVEVHRGYLLSELLSQGEGEQQVEMILNTGTLLWSGAAGGYVAAPAESRKRLLSEPHILGLTRELALGQIGSWVGSLFIYQPPQFGLRPSEQRLLTTALEGGTDEQLAEDLGISLSAVKKVWLAIYRRIAGSRPALIPDEPTDQRWGGKRGKEKKQRLIAYLREHPEELRPLSRKLLPSHAARWRSLPAKAVTSIATGKR